MRFIAADGIFTGGSEQKENSVIVLADDGTIEDILSADNIDPLKTEQHTGFICPGFVNTHCHLELSFMKDKIESGGGLHHFIKEVEKLKKPADEEVQDAIQKADAEMYANGIVTVGDICNTSNTFAFKQTSNIRYHNFLEIYAFDENRAEQAFERGLKLREELKGYLKDKIDKCSSITPHAPYSASAKLLGLLAGEAEKHHSVLTIHNQETEAEDIFFKEKKGNIAERLAYFGIDISGWKHPGTSSLLWFLPLLPKENSLQLVHNTFTTEEDILFAQKSHPGLFWCFCPNANLYIENKLPAIENFTKHNCKITLGTDSYASNWSLSIWDEIKQMKKNFPHIKLSELIKWGTLNGAELLGIEGTYGSIEKGKKPGLVLISQDLETAKRIS